MNSRFYYNGQSNTIKNEVISQSVHKDVYSNLA